jgi:hypothetical protein
VLELVREIYFELLSNMLNCTVGTLPLKYLGLPVSLNNPGY